MACEKRRKQSGGRRSFDSGGGDGGAAVGGSLLIKEGREGGWEIQSDKVKPPPLMGVTTGHN